MDALFKSYAAALTDRAGELAEAKDTGAAGMEMPWYVTLCGH